MATIKAFKGVRPAKELASQVASLPYDVMNSEEAREMAAGNPNSFLYVIKPEISFGSGIDQYSQMVYDKGRENFYSMLSQGTMQQDSTPCLYIYEQEWNGKVQTGLVAASSVQDYWDDIIKKHEFTRPVKEQDRISHMETTGIHPGPVFLTYPDVAEIDAIINREKQREPENNFIADDGVRHTVWIIHNPETIDLLVNLFAKQVPFTYIADGHHRAASAAKVGRALKEAHLNSTGQEAFNYFLTVLFPANQLQIIDYNRLVQDLNGLSKEDFLKAVGEKFIIEKVGEPMYKPGKMNDFGMYLKGCWYKLTVKPGVAPTNDPVNSLDVAILQNNLLSPILGIDDPRTDNRIDFVGGIRGLNELQKRVDSGEMAVAFALYAVSIEQLIAIADSGNVMPPKSTWFEPKLRSGLIVHRFEE